MALTKLTANMNNIQTLADRTVNQATAVKVLHDKAGNDIKTYINEVLTPEIDVKFSIPEGGAAAMALAAYNGTNPVFVSHLEDTTSAILNAVVAGAVADRTTDNTALINTLVTNMSIDRILYIPRGVKWDYTGITHKEDVVIWDCSGWDYAHDDWTSQHRWFFNTSDNEMKNGNEYIVNAPSHPAIIVDNKSDVNKRASFVTRQQGVTIWRLGHGIYEDDTDFVIAVRDPGTGDLAARFTILQTGEIGVGLIAIDTVAFAQSNQTDQNANIIQHRTPGATDTHRVQYLNNNSLVSDKQIDENGVEAYLVGGKIRGSRLYPKQMTTNTTLTGYETNSICTNTSGSGGIIATLPLATSGSVVDFVCTGQAITAKPRTGEQIRGLLVNQAKRSSVVGSCLTLKCIIDGTWEIFTETGTWTVV